MDILIEHIFFNFSLNKRSASLSPASCRIQIPDVTVNAMDGLLMSMTTLPKDILHFIDSVLFLLLLCLYL